MKRLLLICILTGLGIISVAQTDPNELARPIVEEGKRLYKLEMASWYGTDLFLDAYGKRENLKGYFSYISGDTAKCIFYSKEEPARVIGTIYFDSTCNTSNAIVEIIDRDFTDYEAELYDIRSKTLDLIHQDTMFKMYKNTNLNLIPLIHNGEKKVYILTGPTISGVVIFGNDYLISFNDNNEVVSKRCLHNNIIVMDFRNLDSDSSNKTVSGIHTHLKETGDFITATDICTIMLYSKYTGWEHYYVTSEKYLNIWDCKKNSLLVMKQEVLEKIDKDVKKRKKKKERQEKRERRKKAKSGK